ncbi:MAG: septal ring lytic transglycosylase RlpA family protein [Desulfuromonadales bacterium]
MAALARPEIPMCSQGAISDRSRIICRFVWLLLAMVQLQICGCAGKPQAVTPPEHSTIRQKAGQKPYTVDGTRHVPLASSEGFVQEGLASSYGRDFHGRTTSSGEPFDMHAMTAAHKTLPLGVYVKVLHKRSGNEVIVRINDRGPFVRDRIIDLSEGAAKRLGMLQEGIAPVKVTALGWYQGNNQAGQGKYNALSGYDSGVFVLQVAALKNRENAHRYAGDLKLRYGAADVQEAVVGGSTFYRVRMGRFTSLKEAQKAQENYERNGFPGNFIVAVD